MRSGHTVTKESLRRLKKLLDKDRYQPPLRKLNTRPFDNPASGGGDQILFEIVDVVCADGEELYILVEWTHYTGACGTEPPGVDPYTGYIQVYDSCVLSYYTTDFLLGPVDGPGVTGRATYWYPRTDAYGNCEPRWIVDSICGTPECS